MSPGQVEITLALIFAAIDPINDDARLAALECFLKDLQVSLPALLILGNAQIVGEVLLAVGSLAGTLGADEEDDDLFHELTLKWIQQR